MNASSRREGHTKLNAQGQWVVIDVTDEGTSLLSVGQEDFQGRSPRNLLDEQSRVILLDKLRQTISEGEDFSDDVSYAGARYTVTVTAIWSPDRRQVVGAYGLYTAQGSPVPPPPAIGTWQWRVNKQTGKNVGDDASLWDKALYGLYELPPASFTSQRGPAGDWLNKLIAPKDRDDIKYVIDSGINVNNRKRHLLSYEIITRYGSDHPGSKQISMSARAYDDPDYPDAVMLRGFSRQVQAPTKIITPGLNPVSSGLMLEAAFALVEERAFAAVDLVQEVTFRTSPSWERLGLPAAYESNIATLAHPADREVLQQYLADTARQESRTANTVAVRFRTGPESWTRFDLAASRIDVDSTPSRYLMTSLVPTEGVQ